MTTETLIRKYSLEEFFELDLPEEDGPYELIRGEIVPKRKQQQPGPSKERGEIIARVALFLGNYLLNKKVGKVFAGAACIIPAVDYLIPDVSYYLQNRVPVEPNANLPYPDIAVEVVSKSDVWFKVREKVEDYLNAGTSAVWIIFWPDKELYVYQVGAKQTLTIKDELEDVALLPGFKLSVRQLFEE